MKVALVNLSIDAGALKAHFQESDDFRHFDDIWKAIAFTQEEGNAIIVNREDAVEIADALQTAEINGIEIVEVSPEVPNLKDATAVAEWLGKKPEEFERESDNPMLSILNSDSWDESIDTESNEDEYNGPVTSFRDIQMPDHEETSAPETDEDTIVGLNRKVQITKDMITMEERRKSGRTPYEPSKRGFLLTVTSGFGGGGKTTVSYYTAQIMKMALKNAKNDRTEVILIEADYGNPKLQNRLNIPSGQDLSKLANFLDAVNRGEIDPSQINILAEQIIEDIIFEDAVSGVKIIACPYDKSRANPAALRESLKKVVMWAQRTMGYFVVLDADTIGLAEGVELDLIEMSNRVVVITNTREPKVTKKKFLFWKKEEVENINPNDRTHIDDALVMIRVFTRPISQNGFGIPGNRIRVFFNETSAEELENKVLKKDIFPKNMVVGNLPIIPEIDRTWAGDVARNQNRAIEVAKNIAEYLLRTTEYREVDQLLKAMRAG